MFADFDFNVQFFFDFTTYGGFDFLIYFLLAAGKFPEASQQAVGLALIDEDFAFLPDDADPDIIMGDRWAFNYQRQLIFQVILFSLT